MPMCAENKRQYAEQKARCKTDEIEIRPCHNVRLRSPDALRDGRASCGFKASNNRSANPGVSEDRPQQQKTTARVAVSGRFE